MKNYWKRCLIASWAWAILAAGLAAPWIGSQVLFGIAAAPVIGLLVGLVGRRFHTLSPRARGLLSLVTLYLATLCFALIVGAAKAYFSDLNAVNTLTESALGFSLGLLLPFGAIIFLWPLSYLTHCYVSDELNPDSAGTPELEG